MVSSTTEKGMIFTNGKLCDCFCSMKCNSWGKVCEIQYSAAYMKTCILKTLPLSLEVLKEIFHKHRWLLGNQWKMKVWKFSSCSLTFLNYAIHLALRGADKHAGFSIHSYFLLPGRVLGSSLSKVITNCENQIIIDLFANLTFPKEWHREHDTKLVCLSGAFNNISLNTNTG